MIIEYIESSPKMSIIVIALLVAIFTTTVRYYMIDKGKMKVIRARQKELRKDLKKFRDNPEKMMEINKQLMEDMPEQMKQSFKPMIITLIPLLILFKWLWSAYELTSLSGTWLWWYIGSSIIFSIFLSKAYGLQ
jgi:uncharacterized membrane protein (DUF106 family)